MAAKRNNPQEAAALKQLKAKADFWKGKYRYLRYENGQWVKFPGFVGTAFYTDPDQKLRRQVCSGLNDAQTALKWVDMPDAPETPRDFTVQKAKPVDEKHLIEPTPPFDWRPPSYNSDTHSGGPANFDGYGGGADNPRNPELEGEVQGEHQSRLEAFQAEVAANVGS